MFIENKTDSGANITGNDICDAFLYLVTVTGNLVYCVE